MVRELANVAGIARAFGVTPRTAQRWATRPDFPDPIREGLQLADGSRVPVEAVSRVWDLADVEQWARDHLTETGTLPRSGRPPKSR